MRSDPLPHPQSTRKRRAGWQTIGIALGALLVAARVLGHEPQDGAAERVAADEPRPADTSAAPVQAIRDRLRARLDVFAYEEPLANVLRRVAANHQVRIWFDEAAIDEAGLRLDDRVSVALRNFPGETAIERLLRGRRLQHWIDDDVLVIGVAPPVKPLPLTARRGLKVIVARADNQGIVEQRVSEATFDAWVFGNDYGGAELRARLSRILRRRADAAAERCTLTAAQQQKLELAGRGDIARFFERLNGLRSDFLAVKDDEQKRMEFFDQQVVPLEAIIENGPFGAESLFAKALATILTPVQAAHTSSRQIPGYDHLARIGLALSGYHDRFGRFPAAVMTGPDGTTTHSWRVALLPLLRYYVDRQLDDADDSILSGALSPDEVRRAHWKQIEGLGYRLSEPWDSADNRAVQNKYAGYYRHPADAADSEKSSFFAVTGETTAFPAGPGIRLGDFADGPGLTLLVAEARRDIPWTKPEDIPFDPERPVPPLGGPDEMFFLALTADGAVHPIARSASDKERRALITRGAADAAAIPGIPWRPPVDEEKETDETETGASSALIVHDGPAPAQANFGVVGGVPIPDESLVVDDKTRGVANVVVYLDKIPAGIRVPAPPQEPRTMVVVGGRFEPRLSVVRTGQHVVLTNNDPGPENVHTSAVANPATNQLLPAGGQARWNYERREKFPVVIRSDLHPWMRAYQMVVDHPWAAVSNFAGVVTVKRLPPGHYVFKVWHEKVGYLEKSLEVEIKAGEKTERKLVYPPETFQR
jgi:hypothetical protein